MAASAATRSNSPWPKREQRLRERELKREAVLRTAAGMFNERGFHATSIDDVAEALDVTKPTIYHYFATKDEILFECVRRGVESIGDADVTDEQPCRLGLERLAVHMRNYAFVMSDVFGMCVTRTVDSDLSEASRAKFRALKRETDQTLRRVVEEGMRDGSIAPGDARLVTFTLAGALNWIARWYDPHGTATRDDIADGVVATLVRGLAPRGGAEV